MYTSKKTIAAMLLILVLFTCFYSFRGDCTLAPSFSEGVFTFNGSQGIVSVRDAAICAEAGCAGIIISHHQNMFPWTVPPLQALREIRKEVGYSLKILIDSDFETGYDVFKALAFGADGVFVARPLVPVFREKGAEGVAERIRSMTDELRCCLARTASPDIAHIDPEVVVKL